MVSPCASQNLKSFPFLSSLGSLILYFRVDGSVWFPCTSEPLFLICTALQWVRAESVCGEWNSCESSAAWIVHCALCSVDCAVWIVQCALQCGGGKVREIKSRTLMCIGSSFKNLALIWESHQWVIFLKIGFHPPCIPYNHFPVQCPNFILMMLSTQH